MSGVRGVLAGSLGLIALQAVVATDESASRTGQLASTIAAMIAHAVSPALPLIPDLREGASAKPSSTTGGASTASLPADQFSLNPRQVPKPAPATPPPVIAGGTVNA